MSKQAQAPRAQQLTSSLDLAATDANIKRQQASKGFAMRECLSLALQELSDIPALDELILSTQGKLDTANSIIAKAEARELPLVQAVFCALESPCLLFTRHSCGTMES